MIDVLGVLEGEQLQRWQMCSARHDALEMNPAVYSQSESEQITMAYHKFFLEARLQYGIEDDFTISRSGVVRVAKE